MTKTILLSILGIIIVAAAVVYFQKNTGSTLQPVSERNQTSSSVTPTNDQFPEATPDNSIVAAGSSSYLDPQGVYGFLYPNDYTLDTSDAQHPRIYKRGATQQGQTEMYDGVLIVFESVDLEGKSLEEWVDERIDQSTADGTLEIIKPKAATRVNGYPGFTYETRGLGSSTNVILQKDSNSESAVVITYLVADPEELHYQSEVDAVLTTLELRK